MTSSLIVTDLQKQDPGSQLVSLFELQLDSDTWVYLTSTYYGSSRTFASTDVNTSTEEITITGHGWTSDNNGLPLVYENTSGTGVSPLISGTTYYLVYSDANNIKLASTQANARAGTPVINLTSGGTERKLLTEGKVQFRDRTTTTTINEYDVVPIEMSGKEYRTEGALPRPTLTIANVLRTLTDTSLEGVLYLANGNVAVSYNDLLGNKIIKRTTLKKYLYCQPGDSDPPVEYPIEMYYLDRVIEENNKTVSFELVSSFDLIGVTVPRRTIISSGCTWKYRQAGPHLLQHQKQGACRWFIDSAINLGGAQYFVYVNKADEYVVSSSVSFTSTTYSDTTTTRPIYSYSASSN